MKAKRIIQKLVDPNSTCIVNRKGDKCWYDANGELQRVEYDNGDKRWFKNGKRHRLDGPACEFINGHKAWYVDGKLHRLDGPAYEFNSKCGQWFVDGKQIPVNSKEELVNYLLGINLSNQDADWGL